MKERDDMGRAIFIQSRPIVQKRLLGVLVSLVMAIAGGMILAAMLTGCAATPGGGSSYGAESGAPDAAKEAPGGATKKTPEQGGETKLGIRMEGLRLSAAGYMLDFRYRVTDPVKAAPLLDKKVRPYLLDEESGAQLAVPDTPKLGQLRTTGRNKVIHDDRDYFILFANPGRLVQAGSKMTLVMGDLRIGNITVE